MVIAILHMRHYHYHQHREMVSLPHVQEHNMCVDLVSPDESKHSALRSTLDSIKDVCLIHIQELTQLYVHRTVVPHVHHIVEHDDSELVHCH